MNRIRPLLLAIIMICMVLPSQSEASHGRLCTGQARARALQLSHALAQRARSIRPVYRVAKIAHTAVRRCKSAICHR